jgi:hypothetical protein
MRTDRDPMERLAAADPLRDGERLTPEEEREADELLARLLAAPPAAAERPGSGRRRIRRWTLAAAAVFGVAAAVLVATSLVDSEAPGGGIVERAVAAVSQHDVIYHVVERTRAEVSYAPDEDTTIYNESWHTTDGRIHQRTFAARDGRQGRLLHDFAGRRIPGPSANPVLIWEASSNTIREAGFRGPDTRAPFIDPFNDPGTQLRALEAEGRLRMAGETRVGGRQAYRLVSGQVPHPRLRDGVESVEYLVDTDTYLPLARSYSTRDRLANPEDPGNRIRIVSRFLVYERLPLNEKNRALLDLDPHPGAKCSQFAHELTGQQGVGFPNPCPPPPD